MNKKIINYAKHKIFNNELKAISNVLKSNYLTQGPKTIEFENKIKDYCKSKYAVAVNSATSALHISCLLYKLKPTDIVWTSPNSFVASANCALYCGAKIDFVDIDPKTYNISIKDLEHKLLKAKSKKLLPKILVVVHHGGNPVDLKRVYQLSILYKFKIIEDASHALGSEFNGNRIYPLILFIVVNSSIIFLGYKISEISKLLSLCVFIIGFSLFFIIRLFKFKKT